MLWGIKRMRDIYRRLGPPPAGITVHNGEYKALVENMEQLKRATAEMLVGHKLTVDILGSMAVKQEAMAGVLDALPCRVGGSQLIRPKPPATTCGTSPSKCSPSKPPTSMESAG